MQEQAEPAELQPSDGEHHRFSSDTFEDFWQTKEAKSLKLGTE